MIFRIYGKWLAYIKKFYLKLKLGSIYGYCRECGRRVHDFIVPDKIWEQVTNWKQDGLLCYDCFCEKSDRKGLFIRIKGEPMK